MKKIRWGILSTAKIGVEQVIPAMQQGEYSTVTAIASRQLDKAQAAATSLGIPAAYGSYAELLEAADVDAVYNPLPNHLHVPWSIRAMQAGKHVLCEKPIGLSSTEGQLLADAARKHPQLKVMEAFMYRHHPQWQRAKRLVTDSAIGDLKTIQSLFAYHNDDPENIRNNPDMGGGGLMDIGCYPISLSRWLFDAEPTRVLAVIENDPRFAVDRICSGLLDFGIGTATFMCGTQLTHYQRVNIFGSQGQIEIEIPFNAPPDRPCRLWHQHDGRTDEITLDVCNQYTIQGDLFSQAILNDTNVPTPLEDAVGNMKVIEALMESAERDTWMPVE